MKINLQNTAFVFPGQGSQTIGMGNDLAAQYPIQNKLLKRPIPFSDFISQKTCGKGLIPT